MAEFDAGSIKSTADVDLTRFKRGLDEAEKRGKAFDKSTWKAKLDLDDDAFDTKLRRVEARLAKIGNATARLDLTGNADKRIDATRRSLETITGRRWAAELDVAGAAESRGHVESLERALRRLDGRTVSVPVGLRGHVEATAQLQALDTLATRLGTASPTIAVGLTGATTAVAELGALDTAMRALDGRNVTARLEVTGHREAQVAVGSLDSMLLRLTGRTWKVKVELDGLPAAMMQLNALGAMLQRLNGYNPRITPDVDLGPASAQLAALRAQLAAINNQQTNARVGMSGGGTVMGIIGLILAGLGAVEYAAPAAAAALATIPQALVGAGTIVGALVGSLSGVGDAYKAMGEQDTSSAGASAAAGRQRQAAADQVRSATRSLQQAHEQASRSAITSEWSVADAARAASEARVQAQARVAAAERAAADARQAASQRVQDAMRSEQRSAEQLKAAQDNLTRAWRTGREELEDLQLALEGGALSQERAAIGLERARQRLAEGIAKGVDGLDRAELELDVREAEYGLKTAAERMGDLNEQQRTFAREGVAGSSAVKSARDQLRAAEQAYADTVRSRQQAERDGARQVQAAEEQLRAAQVEGRKQVADADRAYSRAALQARWAQADAASAVTAAEDQLAQAIRGMGQEAVGGAKKVDKLAEAMGKLTPEGRDFVRFLHGEFVPAWRPIKEISQQEFLPRVTDGMRRLIGLQPTVTTGVGQMAAELGTLAVEAGKVTQQPAFRRQLGDIMESNARSVGSFGRAGLSSIEMLVDLGASSNPVVERFARLAEYSAQSFESFILGKAATGELTMYLQGAGDRLGQLVDWLGQVGRGVWDLSVGMGPLGQTVLTITGNVVEFIGWLAQLNPTISSLVGGAILATGVVLKLGGAIAAMKTGGTLAGVASLAGGLTTLFNPAALASTAAMGGLMTRTSGMAQRMGMGSAAANTLAARATVLASSLPLVGLAAAAVAIGHDAMTTSSSEAAEALLQGGAAAGAMRAELAENDATMARNRQWMPTWLADLEEWTRGTVGVMTTTEQANAELERQIATMGPLEAAQARATLAQSSYETALRNTGPASAETAMSLQALRDRTRDVEIAQVAAREKVDLATAAVIYQRDTILGTLSADLRKRQATQQLARSQDEYAKALEQHGPNSREAIDAGLQLESTQLQVAEAAKAGRDGMAGYGRSVGDMVTKSRGELNPTLLGLVQTMDMTALSAAGARVEIDGAGRAVAVFPGNKRVVLNADASAVPGQLAAVKTLVDSTRGTVGVYADTFPGAQAVGGFKLRTDATTGVVTIDGNISPADQDRLGIKAKTDGTTGTMWIDGNEVPADGRLNGMRVKVDRTTGVMTIDGNRAPADDQSRRAHDFARTPQWFDVDADTRPAINSLGDVFRYIGNKVTDLFGRNGMNEVRAAFGMAPLAEGAIVERRATGSIDHRGANAGVVGMAGGGLRSMRSGVATTVPRNTPTLIGDNRSVTESYIPHDDSARSQAILAETARAMGYVAVPRDVVAMAAGGTLARGGGSGGAPSSGAGATGAAAPAPTAGAGVGVDAGQQAAAAAGMSAVTGAATSQAATLTGVLVPALAAAQVATAAAVAEQQRMVAAGVSPLVASIASTLVPALGVQAPAALGVLQAAQLATRLSTQQTQGQTQSSSTVMAAAVAAMSLAQQAQHAALRGGQALTRGSTLQTQLQTQGSHAAMTASTTGMSLASQAQLAGLRLGQGFTQQSTTQTAQNMAANNANMQATTGTMRAVNEGHLAGLRGAQAVTAQATTAFADAWRAQLGRTMPDSANPLRWVINFPVRGITDAWNHLDRQFALGKQVPPYAARFKTGGVAGGDPSGIRPGYSPGRDTHQIAVGGGEAIMRPEWTNVVGSRYIDQANMAARRGGAAGVQQFLARTGSTNPAAEGRAKLDLMRRFPLDEGARPVGAFAYGGVAPHVAAAGDEITRVFGRMPGGIGGRGSRGNASDHPSGHALDFMTLGNYALGDRVNAHLNANRNRMQVKYLIWKQRIDGRPMEDRGSATANHFDHVHASFKGGPLGDGGGGGGFFDPTPMVDAAFAKVYRQIADVPRFFGPSDQVARGQGIARQGADKVRQKALDQLMASMGSGMVDVSGISGPVVEQVRQVAHRYGWGAGPNWDNGIFPLVAKESSWRPNAANPSSSARGLFQKMTSIHGPIEPTPAGQAAWGLNYIRGRYGTPVNAWAFHRRNNFYDEGGIADGEGFLPKGPAPERVLSARQTDRFDELVDGALSSVRATGQVSILNGDTLAQLRAAAGGDDTADEVAGLRGDVRALMTEVLALARALADRETITVYPSEAMDEQALAQRVAIVRGMADMALS